MKQRLFSLGMILLGNALYALAVSALILPNNLITGGATGIALALARRVGISVELFLLGFNALMLVAGLLLLGKKFVAGTLLSSIAYPLMIGVFQRIPEIATPLADPLLAVLGAGGLIGLGLGLVMQAGASTGGMDIPPLVLKKYWNLSVSGTMALMDGGILLWQAIGLPREHLLYAVLMAATYTLVLNRVLLSGSSRTQVKIVSER
ncbi:MAG: YitT family protein, partial [Oscillospiraceae bacterium]